MQVVGVDIVKTEFLHSFGLVGNGKAKQVGFVPHCYWLDETAGGKVAVSYSAYTTSVDGGINGIGDTGLKNEFGRCSQLWELHNVLPYFFGGSVDLY